MIEHSWHTTKCMPASAWEWNGSLVGWSVSSNGSWNDLIPPNLKYNHLFRAAPILANFMDRHIMNFSHDVVDPVDDRGWKGDCWVRLDLMLPIADNWYAYKHSIVSLFIWKQSFAYDWNAKAYNILVHGLQCTKFWTCVLHVIYWFPNPPCIKYTYLLGR